MCKLLVEQKSERREGTCMWAMKEESTRLALGGARKVWNEKIVGLGEVEKRTARKRTKSQFMTPCVNGAWALAPIGCTPKSWEAHERHTRSLGGACDAIKRHWEPNKGGAKRAKGCTSEPTN